MLAGPDFESQHFHDEAARFYVLRLGLDVSLKPGVVATLPQRMAGRAVVAACGYEIDGRSFDENTNGDVARLRKVVAHMMRERVLNFR